MPQRPSKEKNSLVICRRLISSRVPLLMPHLTVGLREGGGYHKLALPNMKDLRVACRGLWICDASASSSFPTRAIHVNSNLATGFKTHENIDWTTAREGHQIHGISGFPSCERSAAHVTKSFLSECRRHNLEINSTQR